MGEEEEETSPALSSETGIALFLGFRKEKKPRKST